MKDKENDTAKNIVVKWFTLHDGITGSEAELINSISAALRAAADAARKEEREKIAKILPVEVAADAYDSIEGEYGSGPFELKDYAAYIRGEPESKEN